MWLFSFIPCVWNEPARCVMSAPSQLSGSRLKTHLFSRFVPYLLQCLWNDLRRYRTLQSFPLLTQLGLNMKPTKIVFEYCILNRYGDILYSADNQFGFKKSLGCSHAIYAVRSIVEYFTCYASTVNLCAIDFSKPFDKGNLHALFIKLMNRNIPV